MEAREGHGGGTCFDLNGGHKWPAGSRSSSSHVASG